MTIVPEPAAPEFDSLAIWARACMAARLFAVDPHGLGGVWLQAGPGPVRDAWLAALRALLPETAPVRRLPTHATDDRLIGGLDLAATLSAGRPIADRGLLAEVDGGVLLAAMAERLSSFSAARVAAALDAGQVALERDGLGLRNSARFGIVLLDEGRGEDERPPTALVDRTAFHVDLDLVSVRDLRAMEENDAPNRRESAAARACLAETTYGDEILDGICATAEALGVDSVRAAHFALRAACVAAAMDGRTYVTDDDAALAVGLVLAPRATRLPPPPDTEPSAPEETESPEPPPASNENHPQAEQNDSNADETPKPMSSEDLQDLMIAAAQAAIPDQLLAQLMAGGARARVSRGGAGKSGALEKGGARGRQVGVTRGDPRRGGRLDVIATLRTAAPWQRIRRAQRGEDAARLDVRKDDFHIARIKRRRESATIFVVDASGSHALNRMAEAKGAIELLLADCYARRDDVALIAFRGSSAEVLLPPTRSLVRAKRSLSGLPGGGGTPLYAGVMAARDLADGLAAKGRTPTLVFLTDGRANIGRDGVAGRAQAEEDALTCARDIQVARHAALVLDTSPRPDPKARRLAEAMGARYQPLPFADAARLSETVKAATA